MTDERCKQLMIQVGHPDSMSLRLAFEQLANEVEIETARKFKDEISGLFHDQKVMGELYTRQAQANEELNAEVFVLREENKRLKVGK